MMILEIALGISAICAGGGGFIFGRKGMVPIEPVNSKNADTVNLVCDLLIMGKDWKLDQYNASHPVGVNLWIANGPRSVGLTLDGGRASPRTMNTGGVQLTEKESEQIWAAYKRMGGGTDATRLAEKITRMYATDADTVVPFERRA